MNKILVTLFLSCMAAQPAHAWYGWNVETGAEIEIGKGNLVRDGRTITILDSEDDEEKEVLVIDIYYDRNKNTMLEIEDDDGERRTFLMESYRQKKARKKGIR